jgi:8-oxo-dGTP diphosphatase
MYSYAYPHPAVTTDIVIFTIDADQLKVLLIKRKHEPYANFWALPGGFVDIDEDIEAGALRELNEETGVTGVYLEQLYTFGQPQRDPRERVITIAYYALVPIDKMSPEAASDAIDVNWFPCSKLPKLAFDHPDIIAMARQRLAAKLNYSTIALQFMPTTFTLSELQNVYEIILDEPLDKRNFRKRIKSYNCLKETGETRHNNKHRPARLFTVKSPGQVDYVR